MSTIKISATACKNPQTKANGFRTTVKANSKTSLSDLLTSACKGTTIDADECALAVKKLSRGLLEEIAKGNIIEIDGVGNLSFSIQSAWTQTADEQKDVQKTLGITFVPKPEVRAAVKALTLVWAKTNEEDTSSDSSSSGGTSAPELEA